MRGRSGGGSSGASIVVVGLGHLGGPLLDALALEPAIDRIVACSPSPARGEARVNLARVNAAVASRGPTLEHHRVDLEERGQLAEVLDRVRPEVAIHCASRQTWWLLDLLPPADGAALRRAGFAAWLPIHLHLALRFMREVTSTGFRGATLNGAYPDVVDCVLGNLGIAPTCGFGNVDEMATKIALLAAQRLECRPDDIEVTLIAHHALEAVAFASPSVESGGHPRTEPPPFFLRLRRAGADVTGAAGGEALITEAFPLPPGPAWGGFTASCAARLVRGLLGAGEKRLHAPGPIGLPGGYPVRVGGGELRLDPVDGVSREEAIALNRAAQAWDGIEDIEADGTVVLSAETESILHEQLGYRGRRVPPGDAAAMAAELIAKQREHALAAGVDWETVAGVVR